MRICIEKSTGILIESQSFAREGTLLQNAINSGCLENDIEEKLVDYEEYQLILENQPKPPQEHTETEILTDYIVEVDFRVVLLELGLI